MKLTQDLIIYVSFYSFIFDLFLIILLIEAFTADVIHIFIQTFLYYNHNVENVYLISFT